MKLKEYFNQQRETIVSGWDKLEIYQNIISKRNSKSFYPQRKFFVVKSFAYSLVLLFLVLWLYWTYIFNWKFIINKDWFFIQRSNWIKSVQADYVAKIIEFNGNFYIWHNWEYYQGSNISNWDTVTLQAWAEIVFHIDQWTQAKVVWPAKFLITKSENNYKLNLIYWDFIELKSLEPTKPQNIEFSTQNLTIKQSDKTKSIDFQLVKEWEKTLLKNNWPQLTVTQNNQNNNSIQKELNSDKILSIQDNDISIIKDEKLSQAITQKNFTQTLSFNNTTNTWDLNEILNKEYSQKDWDEWIIKNIWLPNDKLIPTEEQMSKLLSNLSKNTLSKNIKQIQTSYSQWDDSINTDIVNLESKIKQIYSAFDINYTKISWTTSQEKITQLINKTNTISSTLQEKYHIPPTYISNLQEVWLQLSDILK
jgi:hypothetical protein